MMYLHAIAEQRIVLVVLDNLYLVRVHILHRRDESEGLAFGWADVMKVEMPCSNRFQIWSRSELPI